MIEMETLLTEFIAALEKNNALKEKLARGIEVESSLRRIIIAEGGEERLAAAIHKRNASIPDRKPSPRDQSMTTLIKKIVKEVGEIFTITDLTDKIKAHGREAKRSAVNIILWKMVRNGQVENVTLGRRGAEGTYRNKTL